MRVKALFKRLAEEHPEAYSRSQEGVVTPLGRVLDLVGAVALVDHARGVAAVVGGGHFECGKSAVIAHVVARNGDCDSSCDRGGPGPDPCAVGG